MTQKDIPSQPNINNFVLNSRLTSANLVFFTIRGWKSIIERSPPSAILVFPSFHFVFFKMYYRRSNNTKTRIQRKDMGRPEKPPVSCQESEVLEEGWMELLRNFKRMGYPKNDRKRTTFNPSLLDVLHVHFILIHMVIFQQIMMSACNSVWHFSLTMMINIQEGDLIAAFGNRLIFLTTEIS